MHPPVEDPTATSWSSEVVMLGLPCCIDMTTVESDEGATAALESPWYRLEGPGSPSATQRGARHTSVSGEDDPLRCGRVRWGERVVRPHRPLREGGGG